MTTVLEQQLTEAMHDATATSRVPDGLLDGAFRRHRRRTRTLQAGAVAAVAVGAAVVVPAATAGPGGRQQSLHQVTAAFVTRQVQAVLAHDSDEIMMTTTITPGDWTNTGYRDPTTGRDRTHTTRPDGTTVADSYGYRHGSEYTNVVIDYQQRTWSTITLTRPSPTSRNPLPQTADEMQAALHRGTVAVSGRGNIDGHPVLMLTVSSGALPPNNTIILSVDSSTYQLIRLESVSGTPPMHSTTNYNWLPRTPANLAILEPDIPTGFTQQP